MNSFDMNYLAHREHYLDLLKEAEEMRMAKMAGSAGDKNRNNLLRSLLERVKQIRRDPDVVDMEFQCC